MARPRRGRALRGREPRRPLDRRARRLHQHELLRHQRRHGHRPPARDRPGRAHRHRRGVRLGRGRLVEGDRSARAPLAVLGVEGRLRPHRALVPPHLRRCRSSSPGARTTSGRTSTRRRRSRCSPPTCSTAQPIPLYGDGLNERDWLYVDDHCAGVHLVLARGRRRRDLQHRRRQRDAEPRARRQAARAARRRARRWSSTSPTGSATTAATPSTSPRSPTLGWRKQRTLDEALEETVDWYRDNRWWWEPLKARA